MPFYLFNWFHWQLLELQAKQWDGYVRNKFWLTGKATPKPFGSVHIPDRWESAENWKQNSDPRSIYSVTSRITSMLSFLRSSSPLQIGCCCSVVQSCLTLCKPMDCSMPGFPVLHCLLELAQTHVHWVGDAIHLILCHPLLLPPGSFQMSQLFTSGGQSIGVSAGVLPMNIQDGFPLGLTSLISLQSKGLSRVFSNTTDQKHQFFSSQSSLWFNSHIHTWLMEKQ